ncbi:MAG: hypothetical protein Ct9H300mP11_00250 [Chloroflexota bacterium]|nr:MAG: hypothetical protein Ct9H300mP11_00250 [Chloroflexota bacterium]
MAEQAGFDSCFFGEHHQDKDGFLPSPLIVCTAVAASTTKLRVGTSVILLPLHHPVRLAEDVVTLDIVSKGRVTVGVGLGYQQADFDAFGVNMSDRVELFEEKVEILHKCWSGEEFSFHGKHHQLTNLLCGPNLFQRPNPPLWIGASAPVSARRAANIADAIVTTPSTTLENTANLIGHYNRAALAAGKTPKPIIMRDAWVANSRKEAREFMGLNLCKHINITGRTDSRVSFIKNESELTLERVAKARADHGGSRRVLNRIPAVEGRNKG